MLAKDIMTKEVTTVKPDFSVDELAKTFARHRISGAPVVDENGKLTGVVSDSDILGKKGERVSSLMSNPPIFVSEDVPVEKIAELLVANKIKRVPVLSGEKLVGIVSRGDIIWAIAMGKHIAVHTPSYDL
ncbi:MAG TPA: CBS domain-containing protein [Terriglobales bacterium]|jgi:CBS domain-containing protein|nr:CBS domain-containing protein [Terriglobales bacterium]